jgi:hypothetical protein
VDCEFAAQYLVLGGLGRVAGETTPETLTRAQDVGALAPEAGGQLIASAALQGTILQLLRIVEDAAFDPAASPEALKRVLLSAAAAAQGNAAGAAMADFSDLEARLADVQSNTRTSLEAVLRRPVG